jgi:hypothetical protein
MKLTRRELAAAALAAPLASAQRAAPQAAPATQTRPAPQAAPTPAAPAAPATPEEELAAARQRLGAAQAALDQVELPPATEPAAVFRA